MLASLSHVATFSAFLGFCAAASADYSEGERVKHKVFGEGTIVSVKKMSNDAMLEVNFDTVGTKKIMANFAKLTKLS